MSLTQQVIRHNLGIKWLVTLMTLGSVLISVAIVAGVILMYFGLDAARGVTVGEFWGFALGFAIGVPAIACPVVGIRMLMLLRDLNATKDELARIADTDQLSGLLNRRGFEKAAVIALASAEKSGQSIAMLMCDIDHFKNINDTYGHDFGDQALKHVAKVIQETLAKYDMIASRYGGEEFALLLPNATTGLAKVAAEELRIACALQPVEAEGKSARVTMSVGVAAATQPQSDLTRLLSFADGALYRAKRGGRNRVEADQMVVEAAAA